MKKARSQITFQKEKEEDKMILYKVQQQQQHSLLSQASWGRQQQHILYKVLLHIFSAELLQRNKR
jgi:hypothetical protein